jgi:hypothetical protein
MENLTLVAHIPRQLLALIESTAAYEKSWGLRVADGVREFLLAASPDFLSALQEATAPDPWTFGFAIVHRIGNVVIGLCGFAGPPIQTGLSKSPTASHPITRERVSPPKLPGPWSILRQVAAGSEPFARTPFRK